MTVLRSREIVPCASKTLTKETKFEPSTPSQIRESTSNSMASPPPKSVSDSSSRRRSLRLARKENPGVVASIVDSTDASIVDLETELTPVADKVSDCVFGLDSEKLSENNVVSSRVGSRKRRLSIGSDSLGLDNEPMNLRSGKRLARRQFEGSDIGDELAHQGQGEGQSLGENVDPVLEELDVETELNEEEHEIKVVDTKGKGIASQSDEDVDDTEGIRRLSRDEKGKGNMADNAPVLNANAKNELAASNISIVEDERHDVETVNDSRRNQYMRQFRDIAQRSAARFAHFSSQNEESPSVPQLQGEGSIDEEKDPEDWPGPFSTAMKIIKDRATKMNFQPENLYVGRNKPKTVLWVPKKSMGCEKLKPKAPSLQELCVEVLADHADGIISLEHVPDALRHKLSSTLCNSRRISGHFLEILVKGYPTEICLRDCSWLSEEQFTKSFAACNTRNLTVLQLDQSGRCIADYILLGTLAKSSYSLPGLTTLSLSGACRLSDVGLSTLVSSAPSLRSINLSQCSLLTSVSISTLADSLGSVLQELYINDCEGIDAMLILPALKKFEHLEVVSLAGIPTVCDEFIMEFIPGRGQCIKELILTGCSKLTNSSLKILADTCSALCALDIANLRKLTDHAVGYLANGCRAIRKLKLCGNAFSDEAIAAYLESSGQFLEELSLNNVKKVGHNTAVSLAKCSGKLECLDLSWCRSLTDEAVGLIVDSSSSLKVLKLFGCTQITKLFLDGHSNPEVHIIGLKTIHLLEHL